MMLELDREKNDIRNLANVIGDGVEKRLANVFGSEGIFVSLTALLVDLADGTDDHGGIEPAFGVV